MHHPSQRLQKLPPIRGRKLKVGSGTITFLAFTEVTPDKGTKTGFWVDIWKVPLSLQKLTPIRGRKLFLALSEKLSTKLSLQKLTPIRGRKL